jgi:hypothetical protein
LRDPEGAVANGAELIGRLSKYWALRRVGVPMPWHAATRGWRSHEFVGDVAWLRTMPTRGRWVRALEVTDGSWFQMWRPAIAIGQADKIWSAAHG